MKECQGNRMICNQKLLILIECCFCGYPVPAGFWKRRIRYRLLNIDLRSV